MVDNRWNIENLRGVLDEDLVDHITESLNLIFQDVIDCLVDASI